MNKVTKTVVIIPALILIIQFFFIDLKDIQYLGCVWAKDIGLPKLCNIKKVQHLGCIWGVPGYMDEAIDNNTGDRSFSFSSDFGLYKVNFRNIPSSVENDFGIKFFTDTEQTYHELTRRIAIAGEKSFFGIKRVSYTRKGYKGEVEFWQMNGFPPFPQCRAK